MPGGIAFIHILLMNQNASWNQWRIQKLFSGLFWKSHAKKNNTK